jgi:hypothetical protein
MLYHASVVPGVHTPLPAAVHAVHRACLLLLPLLLLL